MRRLSLIAAGVAALSLSAPGVALANHGHRHHNSHKRHGHHAKASFEHIGALGVTGSTGTTTTGAPTTPTPPTNENAGKVASYTGGVLTLTLNDGSSVAGKVTSRTRIECVRANPAPAPASPQGDGGTPGDDNGTGDDQSAGDRNQQGGPPTVGADQQQGDGGPSGSGGGDDDQSPSATAEPPCDSSALVPGAIVREAELMIGPGGTEFESIELVR